VTAGDIHDRYLSRREIRGEIGEIGEEIKEEIKGQGQN